LAVSESERRLAKRQMMMKPARLSISVAKRQMMMKPARLSISESMPKPTSAIEPATTRSVAA
jgi:hypothetical protein